ncbi:MAG: rhomboid family intramembrane serine protease [Bacteroidales bacterium]|nr:rhomboid family intramembrane serine protease [Bacteroidales bacterium]
MRNLTPVVKNLLIINVVVLLLSSFTGDFMYRYFSLFYFESELFHPYQFISHMFMHGGFWHLFFNMYTLMIFGTLLENVWGSKKFFLFYMVTGLGAALLHTLVQFVEVQHFQSLVEAGNVGAIQSIRRIFMTPTVGASGAIYGLLLAYGMLFPNNVMGLIFPPIQLKAKWFVLIFGGIELFLGVSQSGGNIAHFAHLGGMLFGLLLILYWKKKGRMYY